MSRFTNQTTDLPLPFQIPFLPLDLSNPVFITIEIWSRSVNHGAAWSGTRAEEREREREREHARGGGLGSQEGSLTTLTQCDSTRDLERISAADPRSFLARWIVARARQWDVSCPLLRLKIPRSVPTLLLACGAPPTGFRRSSRGEICCLLEEESFEPETGSCRGRRDGSFDSKWRKCLNFFKFYFISLFECWRVEAGLVTIKRDFEVALRLRKKKVGGEGLLRRKWNLHI